ncbi:hypothetical protein [Candidatus Borrarchaeum sp.]|uniref:hypothetical protein n=1 Tax=Candidatus Borrarchaeum sp. TaxID=2846742 RepID=UPI00257C7B30|nr:hypothetical protein [Candidatus Borrarchaeum sp.]
MVSKINHFTDAGELFRRLDTIERFPNVPIKTVLFIYDFRYKLLDILDRITPQEYQKSSYKIKFENDDVVLLDVKIVKDLDIISSDRRKVFLIIDKNKPFCILITNSEGNYFKKVLSFFNKHYPLLSRIFLRSNEIKDLLNYLEEKEEAKLTVLSYVVKRYYVRPETRIAYEKISFREVFDKASDDFLWVDSIYLAIEKRSKSKIRINRRGVISYYRNLDYSNIHLILISQILIKYSKIYTSILMERSRSLENLEPRPVRFFINEDVFNSSEDIDRFLEALHKYLLNWGYSTLFKERNYLYLILHDYQTGSSYDILISSPYEIFVTPQTQVTSISFGALVNFLVDNYDGVVENV